MNIFQKVYEYARGQILTAYNKNGDEIYRNSYGRESWSSYNNGLLIKVANSGGLVVKHMYNPEGKLILTKDNKGYEEHTEYNTKGKPIHTKNTNGYEQWWEYDSNGCLKIYKDSNGKENHYKHDPEGKLASLSLLRDGKTLEIYQYDNWGNEIYCKDNIVHIEQWWEYNGDGKMTSYKNSDGEEWLYKYDKKGRLVITEKNDGFREEITYDGAGRVLSIKNSSGFEKIYKYDERGNEIYQKHHVLPEHADHWEKNLISPGEPYEIWQEYNDQNLLIHSKSNDGREEWFTYDIYGNETNKKELKNGKVQRATKTRYLYYEELAKATEWLFPFEELK